MLGPPRRRAVKNEITIKLNLRHQKPAGCNQMALVLKLVQDALNEPDVRAGITSGMVDCHENLRLSGIHTHTRNS